MKLYDNDEYREVFMELVYSLLHSDGTNDRANQIIDAFDSIPAVEAEPSVPSDPLTLEELREMDGDPVWVVLKKDGIIQTEGWALVEVELEDVSGTVFRLHFEDYGECGWLAYRRKPDTPKEDT